MVERETGPQVRDIMSVGSRIHWGAILGGAFMAIALYFMLSTLGAAVGLTISDRMDSRSLETSAVIWAIATFAISVFVGGVMTSAFTVGENKVEAVFYGMIMWAFLLVVSLGFSAVSTNAAANSMISLTRITDGASADWENDARRAGVPANTVEDWRKQANAAAQDPKTRDEYKQAAKRITWYAFGGIWLSMFAAAAGAFVGAGPSFRIVTGPPSIVLRD